LIERGEATADVGFHAHTKMRNIVYICCLEGEINNLCFVVREKVAIMGI